MEENMTDQARWLPQATTLNRCCPCSEVPGNCSKESLLGCLLSQCLTAGIPSPSILRDVKLPLGFSSMLRDRPALVEDHGNRFGPLRVDAWRLVYQRQPKGFGLLFAARKYEDHMRASIGGRPEVTE